MVTSHNLWLLEKYCCKIIFKGRDSFTLKSVLEKKKGVSLFYILLHQSMSHVYVLRVWINYFCLPYTYEIVIFYSLWFNMSAHTYFTKHIIELWILWQNLIFWCIFWLLCLYSEVLRNLFSLFDVSEFKIRGIWYQFILILYI